MHIHIHPHPLAWVAWVASYYICLLLRLSPIPIPDPGTLQPDLDLAV
jgi:hypothetical protein